MARQSYFAEKRGQNNDPNFFNRIPLDELRKNVKRIIKDIRFDMIQEYDYNYFYSTQVLQACISEAEENYMKCATLCNSLNFYINECLNKGITAYPSTNIIVERVRACNEQIAQNTTKEQMKMFLTRLGFGSKAVVTGDLTQTDLPDNKKSGLLHAREVLKGVEGIGSITLTERDVVRHALVQRIIVAYDRYDKKQEEIKSRKVDKNTKKK